MNEVNLSFASVTITFRFDFHCNVHLFVTLGANITWITNVRIINLVPNCMIVYYVMFNYSTFFRIFLVQCIVLQMFFFIYLVDFHNAFILKC